MASVASVPVYLLPGVPVAQPPHLEGDPSLATEILPGPPSLASVQQAASKRDPKKPGSYVSYLPTSDPGSTYGGLAVGTPLSTAGPEEPRRKRARTDKGSTNRAQRASARSLNAAPESPSPPPFAAGEATGSSSQAAGVPGLESFVAAPESDAPTLSRRSSEMNLDESESVSTNGRTRSSRSKGKGKEKEKAAAPVVRVKEEPVTVSLPPLELNLRQRNDDHCSACRTVASGGGLVYCDSCPRAFHFICLDPPLDQSEVGDGDWFCPSCTVRQNPLPRPPRSFMAPLIQHVQSLYPVEYQLPDDVRGFFKDVGSDVRGAYLDSSQTKQPRLDRHGRLEDREPYRLRDRNGMPMLCFRCGKSALPADDTAASASKRPRRSTTLKSTNADPGRSIVSCDYCDLHWHLDCVDPPIPSMPPFGRKWMCPNHSDQILKPKRRIPKQNNAPIDINKPGMKNNGIVEVIQSESSQSTGKKIVAEEVMINGRRYRIPERVITLDFWGKVSRDRRKDDVLEEESSMSTLTSLSSLDELEESLDTSTTSQQSRDKDELRLAQLLCDFRNGLVVRGGPVNGAAVQQVSRSMANASTQTERATSDDLPQSIAPLRRTVKLSNGLAKVAPPPAEPTASASSHRRGPPRRRDKASADSKLPSPVQTDTSTSSIKVKGPEPVKVAVSGSGSGRGRPRKDVALSASTSMSTASRKASATTFVASSESTKASRTKPAATSSPVALKITVAPSVTPLSSPVKAEPAPERSSSPLKIRLPRLSAVSSMASVNHPPASSASSTSASMPPPTPDINTPAKSNGRPRRSATSARSTNGHRSPSTTSSSSVTPRRSGRTKRPSAVASHNSSFSLFDDDVRGDDNEPLNKSEEGAMPID